MVGGSLLVVRGDGEAPLREGSVDSRCSGGVSEDGTARLELTERTVHCAHSGAEPSIEAAVEDDTLGQTDA